MIDRSFIGHEFAPITVDIELGRLRFFAKAIGEEDPLYCDVEAARVAGFRSAIAPPTFTMVIDAEYDSPSMPELEILELDIGNVLHAKQRFEYFAPICAGDRITARRRISNITEKKGGALEFIEATAEYTNQFGELAVRSVMTTVHQNRSAA